MTKYAISSKTSVLKAIKEDGEHTTIILTNKNEGMLVDSAGEAMKVAQKVNKLVGLPTFMIIPTEIES